MASIRKVSIQAHILLWQVDVTEAGQSYFYTQREYIPLAENTKNHKSIQRFFELVAKHSACLEIMRPRFVLRMMTKLGTGSKAREF